MDGILVQDWTTIRVTGATSTVIQAEENWVDIDSYGDLVFWLEVSNLLLGGGTAVQLAYETLPSKDESLVRSLSTFSLSAAATPHITKVLDGIATELPAAWLRWKLSALGSPSGEWGATFRIHCAGLPRGSP